MTLVYSEHEASMPNKGSINNNLRIDWVLCVTTGINLDPV